MEPITKDESKIDDLVQDYLSDKTDARKLLILAAFNPYFRKYAALLSTANAVDFGNKDTTKFLRLFMSKEERTDNMSYMSAARRVIGFLRRVFHDYTTSDVYDEIVCIFLEHLNRYKPMVADNIPIKQNISFTHFIQVNIRYALRELASLKARDALHCLYNTPFDEALAVESKPIEPHFIGLDLKWVHGFTASEPFNQLDEFERYLLFLRYEDEDGKPLSERDIAKMVGADRGYIRRRLDKIKIKLKDYLKSLT